MQLRCPQCGTTYDVSQYPPGHSFACTCGNRLEVGAAATPSTPSMGAPAASTGGSFGGSGFGAADPGMQPIIKVLVFLANLCFSPLAAIVSLIVWFVIREKQPNMAKDLCLMTWIPFAIAAVLWILYFLFVGVAIFSSAAAG
ncbi:MAG: hypothetical protein ABR559_08690 [Gemmatimonadota bacterium]